MKTRIIAKAIVLRGDGKMLILRRAEHSRTRPGQWDLPGGKVDKGEDFDEALVREVTEESGLSTVRERVKLIYSYTSVQREENMVRLIYIGTTQNDKVTLSNEHQDSRWVTLDEAIELYDYTRHKEMLEYVREQQLLDDIGPI
jgi:8-oxo-dGTP diphosphatase